MYASKPDLHDDVATGIALTSLIAFCVVWFRLDNPGDIWSTGTWLVVCWVSWWLSDLVLGRHACARARSIILSTLAVVVFAACGGFSSAFGVFFLVIMSLYLLVSYRGWLGALALMVLCLGIVLVGFRSLPESRLLSPEISSMTQIIWQIGSLPGAVEFIPQKYDSWLFLMAFILLMPIFAQMISRQRQSFQFSDFTNPALIREISRVSATALVSADGNIFACTRAFSQVTNLHRSNALVDGFENGQLMFQAKEAAVVMQTKGGTWVTASYRPADDDLTLCELTPVSDTTISALAMQRSGMSWIACWPNGAIISFSKKLLDVFPDLEEGESLPVLLGAGDSIAEGRLVDALLCECEGAVGQQQTTRRFKSQQVALSGDNPLTLFWFEDNE